MEDGCARRLQARARSLLGPGIGVGHCLIGHAASPLWHEEEEAMARAVAHRRAEFAAGRQAARAAMAALGLAPAAIPMGGDRAPIWPAGLTGSITHAGIGTRALALASVAATPQVGGLGLDLEEDTALAADLWPSVLDADELDWLATQPPARRPFLAKAIFSAKEATYKAQYPHSGALLDFHDISVSYSKNSDIFSATFRRDVPGFAQGTILQGRQACEAGMILSVIRI